MLIVTALVKTHTTLKGRVCTPLDSIVGLLNHCTPCFSIFYFTIRAQISQVAFKLPTHTRSLSLSLSLSLTHTHTHTHVLVLILTFEYQRKCKISSKTVNLV